MGSPELLSVVESCPVGAETLILRILHILTENGIITLSLCHLSVLLFLNYQTILVIHINIYCFNCTNIKGQRSLCHSETYLQASL